MSVHTTLSANTQTTLTQRSHNAHTTLTLTPNTHTYFTHVSHNTQHLLGGGGGQLTSLCPKSIGLECRLPVGGWGKGGGTCPRGSVDEVAQSSLPPTRDTWGGVGGEGGVGGADPARHNSHEFPDRTGAQQVRGWVYSPPPSPHQHVHLILPAVVVAHPLSLKYSCRESVFTKI